MTWAIVRGRGVVATHRRSADLLAPADPSAALWAGLGRLVGLTADERRERLQRHRWELVGPNPL